MGESGQVGKREPEVVSELNELQKCSESTYQELLGLQNRLQGVLKSVPPSEGVDKKEPTVLVPLASEIRKERQKVDMIRNLINDILQRLEL